MSSVPPLPKDGAKGSDIRDQAGSTDLIDEKGSLKKEDVFVESSNDLDDDVVVVNGEPVVVTGMDVSRFIVDLRDDGDEALTFRSMVIGTIFAGLGAALCQVLICTLHDDNPTE